MHDTLPSKSKTVKVGILEDHQSVIDGYQYRLGLTPGIEVVGVARTGAELDGLLARAPIDVLIMDVGVPTSPDNPNPFPILYVLSQLTDRFPELSVLVVSMIADRVLINAIVEAGARGYVLKEERAIIERLGEVVLALHKGGNYISQRVFELLNHGSTTPERNLLTRRQLEALSLCAAHPNWSRAQLASALGVSASTARNLLSGAYLRLGVNTLMAAIAKARHIGLLTGSTDREATDD